MTETIEPTRLPLIGDPAPGFEVESTHGVISLDDYKGKWIMLFSHPADFTPVCTTEFIAFAQNIEEFEKRNVQLIGNSVDSIFSHIGWVQSIQQNAGVEITFPIIADLEMNVAHAYGMIHPESNGTNAVRAVFIIDDKGIVRAMVYYPLNAGRNVDELLRLIDALQTSDREGVSCPANWTPGDEVVVGAPRTTEDLKKRLADDTLNLTDWYLAKKSL
ncbi:MAG: peroxiredoxin [Candidatus Nanopelagicales bacterium]|jgi:peroxiredoxin (alkyl hydroperoxide reductase subunit C)